MNESLGRWLYWTPRAICLAFAAFLSIFALDVFDTPADPWRTALALLVHLLPTGLVLVALTVVWRREWLGAFLFPALAVVHFLTTAGQLEWSAYALIDGPLILLGILFWLNWHQKTTLSPRTG